ncbi:MAG TPA: hypothetical protein VMY35_05515 [Phycisphaerae bacterium]|nr:hypothetical protein [Phycisphaerae bacterium]
MEYVCFGLPVIGVLGLVAAVLIAHQRKRLTFRWWALPVLLILSLASLRFGFIMLVCGSIAQWATGGGRPALWLRELWVNHSWPLLFLGPLGLALVLVFKGVRLRIRTRDTTLNAITVAILIMGPVLALDSFLFMFIHSGFGGKPQEMANAVSPDGQRRVQAFGTSWLGDTDYSLEAEANRAHPILAYPLVTSHEGAGVWPKEGGFRIVWSKDSEIVALWFKGDPMTPIYSREQPVAGYDFARRIGLCQGSMTWFYQAENRQEYENADELNRGLAELMQQHGGAAPKSE